MICTPLRAVLTSCCAAGCYHQRARCLAVPVWLDGGARTQDTAGAVYTHGLLCGRGCGVGACPARRVRGSLDPACINTRCVAASGGAQAAAVPQSGTSGTVHMCCGCARRPGVLDAPNAVAKPVCTRAVCLAGGGDKWDRCCMAVRVPAVWCHIMRAQVPLCSHVASPACATHFTLWVSRARKRLETPSAHCVRAPAAGDRAALAVCVHR